MTSLTYDQKLRRAKLARKLYRRNPGRDYAESIRQATAIVQGRKPRPGRRQAIAEEAVRRAVAKVVAEAVNGTLAARPGQAAATAPDRRPLHELDESDFAAVFAEAAAASAKGAMRSPFWAGEDTAPAPAVPPPGAGDKPLHEVDLQTADAAMAASIDTYAEAFGLRSPFWAGSRG
jgi:hypothetical protein